MSATQTPASAGFVAKWYAREPEMRLAEVFVPRPEKPGYRLWGALLHTLRETAFELSDRSVTEIKSAWWAQELLALAKGRASHPLTSTLPVALPWSGLARALVQIGFSDRRPAGPDDAVAALMPLSQTIIEVESALFGAAAAQDATVSLAVHLLAERLRVGLGAEDAGMVPLSLLARHGVPASALAASGRLPVLRDWAGALLERAPETLPGASLFRQQRAAFDRVRLRRLAAGRAEAAASPVLTVIRAWRTARRSANAALRR